MYIGTDFLFFFESLSDLNALAKDVGIQNMIAKMGIQYRGGTDAWAEDGH